MDTSVASCSALMVVAWNQPGLEMRLINASVAIYDCVTVQYDSMQRSSQLSKTQEPTALAEMEPSLSLEQSES